jgi:hypothetical protein
MLFEDTIKDTLNRVIEDYLEKRKSYNQNPANELRL